MRLRWSAPAVADLVEVRQYIGARNRKAARNVAKLILTAVKTLAEHPALGRPGRLPETRELAVLGTPFVIPYRVREDTLEILRVLHGARRWPER